VTIDISHLRGVSFDSRTRTVRAQGAARLGDIDSVTAQVGLAVPLGTVSDTGVGGLALGGGIGWLLPKYGLTCDNIVEIELVDFRGNTLVVNENLNRELFWGLRGGGGCNFGIVKSFRFNAYPVRDVYAGSVYYPLRETGKVLMILDELSRGDAAQSHSGMVTMSRHPLFGDCVAIDYCCFEPRMRSDRLFGQLLGSAQILGNDLKLMPFIDFQSMFDGAARHGFRRYARSCYADKISVELSYALEEIFIKRPSPLSTIFIEEFHGAIESPNSSSAFSNRDARFNVHIQGCWQAKSDDEENRAWLSEAYASLGPLVRANGSYVNYNSDLGKTLKSTFPTVTTERLLQVKRLFDPNSFFAGTMRGISKGG
jgi:FAD/FMN-containing dehydrogenase